MQHRVEAAHDGQEPFTTDAIVGLLLIAPRYNAYWGSIGASGVE